MNKEIKYGIGYKRHQELKKKIQHKRNYETISIIVAVILIGGLVTLSSVYCANLTYLHYGV